MKKLMLSVAVLTALVATYDANAYSYSVETNDTVVSVNIVNEGDQQFLHETFLDPDVTRVVYNMNNNVIYYQPTGTPTYTGGTYVASAQVRIQKGDALGTGPIILGDGASRHGLLVAEDTSVVVTNKIVFTNDDCWAMSANENCRLTVQRLAGGLGAHCARFGRDKNPSNLDLDLAEDDGNEPLNCIAFRGNVIGTVGGWLKATDSAKSPFLRNSQPGYEQAFNIAKTGLVIDAAAGSDFLLSTNVTLRNTAEMETIAPCVVVPTDASFEDGGTGWSCKKIDSDSGNSTPGAMPNTDGTWVTPRTTTFGDKQMVLRTGHRLTSPEITIPKDGSWRLNFWRTGRNGYSGWNMSTEVVFTNVETGETQTKTLAAMTADISTYEQALSPSFDLTAGRYTFSIYPACKNGTATMLYDNFSVEEADTIVYPANSDFETSHGNNGASPAGGWTVEKGDSPATTFLSGVYNNENSYNSSRPTPFGQYSLLVRVGHKVTSPSFTIPSDGTWRLSFWRVGRKNYSGTAYDTDVTFTDADGVEQTAVLPGENDYEDYRQATMTFPLKAGDYSFSLHVRPNGSTTAVVFYDHFAIEKVFERRVSGGATVTKQGAGRVVMPKQGYTNPFTVTAGSLAFCNSTLDDVSADASGTGCLELGPNLSISADTVVTVASGATLRITDLEDNLVSNGSFEKNTLVGTSATWKDGSKQMTDWNVSCVTPNGNNQLGVNAGGVQKNGGTITPNGPLTPCGDCTAAVREHCKITQTVNVPEAGEYRLSFVYAMRKDYGTDTAAQVLIGDQVVVESMPLQTAEFVRVTTKVSLEAGLQVLTFHVNRGSATSPGPLLLLDDVSLRKTGGTLPVGGHIELKSGATLWLDNVTPLILDVGAITVDGQPVQGRRNDLRRAGVNVTGDGYIRLGDPLGMAIFIK